MKIRTTLLLYFPGGAAPTYLSPYEAELGQQPNQDKMEEYVVERKKRPAIKDRWKQHKVGLTLSLLSNIFLRHNRRFEMLVFQGIWPIIMSAMAI